MKILIAYKDWLKLEGRSIPMVGDKILIIPSSKDMRVLKKQTVIGVQKHYFHGEFSKEFTYHVKYGRSIRPISDCWVEGEVINKLISKENFN